FTRSIDEVLNHANRGAQALWADSFASHDFRNGLGIFGERVFGRKGRNSLHILHPFFLRHGGTIVAVRDTASFRSTRKPCSEWTPVGRRRLAVEFPDLERIRSQRRR